jgi:TonB family protein
MIGFAYLSHDLSFIQMRLWLLFIILYISCTSCGQAFVHEDSAASQPESAYAHFPGGMDSMQSFIHHHLAYPASAWEQGVRGSVTCAFTVCTDGRLTGIHITHGLIPEADSEAVRIVGSMPPFSPRVVNGVPQQTSFSLHIAFSKPMLCTDPDQWPEYPGGDRALLSHMTEAPRPAGEGSSLTFIITVAENGAVRYITTDPSYDSQYQEQVRQFFDMFPAFKPALKGGLPVTTELKLPLIISARDK